MIFDVPDDEIREYFEQLGKVHGAGNYDDFAVCIRKNPEAGYVAVECKAMYATPVPSNPRIRADIREKFDLLDVSDETWDSPGCVTCDYGSEYVREFYLTPKD